MASGQEADIEAPAGTHLFSPGLSEKEPLLAKREREGLLHRGLTYQSNSEGSVDDDEEKEEKGKFANVLGQMPGMPTALRRPLITRNHVQDAMTYHTQDLASWNSLYHVSFTVWNRRSLWMITLKLLGLSTVVALLVLLLVHDPASLKVSKFTEISSFLRVFVGLLLGFFMSASVNRWWSCAEAFQGLCNSMRSLQIVLNSCGVPEEHANHVLRYGVVSAWILHMQLHIEAMKPSKHNAAVKAMWEKIASGEDRDPTFGKVLPEELEALKAVSDPPGQLWMWVGSYLGHLAQEGIIPPLASPTYGRFLGISLEGFNALRDVRASISVQAPFIYVQMLSSLVHINNIVNALSFGMTWGASLGTFLAHWGVPVATHPEAAEATHKEATTDMQTLLVSFFFSCFGPFVYQALLEVSIAIAQPFSNKDAVVPTERILHLLERDLHDGMAISKKISWTQPCFKK